jgi:hypothetical protein
MREGIEGGGCGGVVVQAVGGWGMVHRAGKAWQVWEGRGRGEPNKVYTHSATSVTEEVCVAPPSEVYRKVETQPAWRWGPVGSRLPSQGAKRWSDPTSTIRQRPRSGSLKTRPIKSVPSRVGEGRVDDGSGIGNGGRSDAASEKRGQESVQG